MRPRPWSGKLSALENLIARKKPCADGFYNMCFLGAISNFFVVSPHWLVSFFNSELRSDRMRRIA